jgi:hypothetical protein
VTDGHPELSKSFIAAAAMAAEIAQRLGGYPLSEGFTQRTGREQLWYYGGLLASFERRRPGPLTEDLGRAIDEIVWVLAAEEAQRVTWRRVWVDADLHTTHAPEGWIQVRTASQAIELMEKFKVHEVSLETGTGADAVIRWLIDRGPDDPLLWPTVWVSFHGAQAVTWFDRLAWTGSGPSAISNSAPLV